MSDTLWGDTDIRAALTAEQAVMVAERIRDDYERRIAELEAQLDRANHDVSDAYGQGLIDGHEWQPVEEVVVHCVHGAGALWIGKDGNLQATGKHGPTAAVDVTLPEWLAFCRRISGDQ